MEIRRSRKGVMAIIVTLFVLAVLVAGSTLGYFWYRKSHPEQNPSSSKGGTISLDTTQKVETEKIETALIIPKSTDKPGDTIRLSVLSLTTPKSWRTVNAKALLNTPLEGLYVTSYNDVLAQLIMVPEKQPTDPSQATNSLGIYNITSWLGKSTAGSGGTVSPAVKSAYIQNIIDMGDGKQANKKVCDKSYGVLNPALCGSLLKATPVVSSDGTLKGVVFLNSITQSVGYDPQALVFLTGQVKDQQIFAYGSFRLLDNLSHSLSSTDTDAIKNAWDSFVKGDISSDTMTLYQNVINAIKSISIQANE